MSRAARGGGQRVGLVAVVALALLLAQPIAALAHPLGNFTVNRYSRLEISADAVRVRYVVDMAEIPAFQVIASLDANSDGRVTDAKKDAYAVRTLAQVMRHLHLTVGGAELPMRVTSHEVTLAPGQAGLQTLRLSAWLEAPSASAALQRLSDAALPLSYRDENDPERIGWREIVVHADGVSVASTGTTLATEDRTDELRRYPEDMLSSPLDVRQVQASIARDPIGAAPGGAKLRASRSPSISRASDGLAGVFTRAATARLTPLVILVALASAFVFGGMHAVSPGHGKTIVGAYLVGSRGTARHAIFLGLTVTVVHTAGVFALLVGTLAASQYVVPEALYPWMSLVSGLLVLGMGMTLMRSRWSGAHRRRLGAAGYDGDDHLPGRDHVHAGPTFVHDHGLGAHSHAIPGDDGGLVTWRNLLALGVSGGLLPCPSALVVGLGAIALHEVPFGLVLIVAFSSGLAATLTAVGLLMVYSGRAAGRWRLADRAGLGNSSRFAFVVQNIPVVSAGVVAAAGLGLTFDAARQLDAAPLLSLAERAAPLLLAASVGGTALALGLRRSGSSGHATTPTPRSHAHDGPDRWRRHVHLTPHAHDHGDHDHGDHDHGDHDHGDHDHGAEGRPTLARTSL